jgi:hypothetical protein
VSVAADLESDNDDLGTNDTLRHFRKSTSDNIVADLHFDSILRAGNVLAIAKVVARPKAAESGNSFFEGVKEFERVFLLALGEKRDVCGARTRARLTRGGSGAGTCESE